MSILERAAWVPDDDPQRGLDIRAGLAVQWVEERCVAEGAPALLVLDQRGAEQELPSLARFADRVTTPKARSTQVRGSDGPVLAFMPDAKSLDYATSLARRSSLAVVEAASIFPLRGWAAVIGAVDLSRPDASPKPLDERVSAAVQDLKLYGNNGYTNEWDRTNAGRVLGDLRQEGLLDKDLVLGAVAATDVVSPDGLKRLGRLIDGLS
ncbi:hypothetical protein [Streptomyces sp. NPDC005538]|uniref:hypothetical protein n=1 Tax=Streptomyces sp. NPDC005538 TaxID=3157043 RepID=UPI0033BA7D71